MASVIEFQNVTKEYEEDVIGIENASFSIEKGEFVFLVGKSGAGKSTILRLIAGQLLADSGEVFVDEEDVSKLTSKTLPHFRRKFGTVQKEHGFVSELTVYENIALAMRATSHTKDIIEKRIDQTLNTMGILKKRDNYPDELSGGELQKAMIARAIVQNPSIMLLDEPTANLNSGAAWDVMCLLSDLNRLGVTMIVTSHSRELVSIMKKRVMTMVSGKIVSDEKNAIYDYKKMDIYEEKKVADERIRNKNRRN